MTAIHGWQLVGVAASVVLLGASGAAVGGPGGPPRCFGEVATIVGPQPEPGAITHVFGTPGPDVIFSRWDDQFLHGLGGDDLLCGHATIRGGSGDDRMRVRSEEAFLDASSLHGGPGNDTILRDEELDDDPHFSNRTVGGPGRDRLVGSANFDDLFGGQGRDRILGNGLSDRIHGGRGPDVLVGGRGEDTLRGMPGSDRMRGGTRADTIVGGSGNDVARGGAGEDRIQGGDGVDVALGGPDVDFCEAEEARCELP